MTDAAASTSATTATLPSHADILGRFVQQKRSLLDTLHDTYSDDPTSEAYEADIGSVIAAERTHFLTAIKDDADAQEEAIRDWHATMKPFYSMCKPGQEASVVAARPFQLVKLKFPEMWKDVRLSGESRALLFQYVVNLNQAATMFCAVDADAMAPVMSALSESGIMDCISSGNTGDMDISGMMSKVTSLASSMTPENMASMQQSLPTLLDAMGGVDGVLEKMGEFGLPPEMMEFAKSHAQQFSEEMLAGMGGSGGGTDGISGGGAGAGAGSGIDLAALAAHISKHGVDPPPPSE